MIRRPPRSTLFPYTSSSDLQDVEVSLGSLTVSCDALRAGQQTINMSADPDRAAALVAKFKSLPGVLAAGWTDRKSTRLNSSHVEISYAVFCLKKKKKKEVSP